MFENLGHFFKRMVKTEQQKELGSKDAAKERLHLVLMQDRANVSADFLELMKQEIIDVIKKYIVVNEDTIDVRLTNQSNEDGTNGAPALVANIPIVNIKNDMMAEKIKDFEGVDFNKEIGIPPYEEQQNNKKEPELSSVIEIVEPDEVKSDESTDTEDEEVKEVFQEVDEDEEDEDDDVTFDDLLKAAEAAEKMEDDTDDSDDKKGEVNSIQNNTNKTEKKDSQSSNAKKNTNKKKKK